MTSYRNPFRYRTSEQESRQGLRRFLKTFGAGALDLLPEEVWDRPVIIQSAPGAGKTSLLRTFSTDALLEIARRPDEHELLQERMAELGAIDGDRVRLLGIRLALKRDYQAIDDLRLPPERAVKVFFRLLDVHLVRALVSALGEIVADADGGELCIEAAESGAESLSRIGGPSLDGLLEWSKAAYADLLDQLDSVLPPPLEDIEGHHSSYAIDALSGATFTLAGADLDLRVLLMFDDAQELSPHQREALLTTLADRDLRLNRWLAERYQALSADEVVADGQPHRDYTRVQIEAAARKLGAKRRGRNTKGFARLLLDIADLRASNALRSDAEEERRFHELIETTFEPADQSLRRANEALDKRLEDLTEGNPRYAEWLRLAAQKRGYAGVLDRRLVEILIARDKKRGQDTLFDITLGSEEFGQRSDSGLREAAALFVRRELRIPFYFGDERIARLSSENIEQFINISGELFEDVLARATLGRSLRIDPASQDAIVALASEELWRDIPRRFPEGRRIQVLLLHVAQLCRADTYRPTAPYPPGATATAISMRDRERLLDPKWRRSHDGADELFAALGAALGNNILRADLDYAVKNDRWMVLYLNRLLCPRFGLPLGLGGIRERPVEDLCAWMVDPGDDLEGQVFEPRLQEVLPL
jgi:hypothetical protein